MVKNDRWIKEMARKGMISPFEEGQVSGGKISYGVSSYGYDMRLGNEFVFVNQIDIINPKAKVEHERKTVSGDWLDIAPNSQVLGRSVEYFKIPRDIITIAFGKSTYARCGILINLTPFEPEWEGFVTLSIINVNPLPARIYINEGIAQVLFLEAAEECEVSYSDRKGKYQAQKAVTSSKILI
jgi:dCTP deaminase